MSLDSFDISFLEHPGTPQETLFELLGWSIGESNAKKKRVAIRGYLNFKSEHEIEAEDNKLQRLETYVDGRRISTRLIRIIDLEDKDATELLKLHGYDPAQWKLIKSAQSIWNSPRKDSDPAELYSSRIEVKPTGNPLTEDQISALFDALEAPDLVQYEHKPVDGMMLELPIMDLHLGKLSWADEVGENYKLSIAKKLYKRVVTQVISDIEEHNFPIEKIVFPIGQDFYHMDTIKGTTSAGTYMDSDTRWPKMYFTGTELLIWAVENLRKVAPVECLYSAGNHDRMLSYCLTNHVAAWFRNVDDVKVNISPDPQQYVKYGKVLIGFSHGKDEGKRIDTLMQAANPKAWGRSVYREWHLGHLHSEHAREVPGVIVRRIPAITATDNWHKEHGYKALRKAQAFLWDREKGKRFTIDVNVTA